MEHNTVIISGILLYNLQHKNKQAQLAALHGNTSIMAALAQMQNTLR
jgi:hypothetical protein